MSRVKPSKVQLYGFLKEWLGSLMVPISFDEEEKKRCSCKRDFSFQFSIEVSHSSFKGFVKY